MVHMPVSGQRGLPARYFLDEDIFAKARDQLFFKSWQLACHASELAEPGRYITLTLFNQDLFVVRTREGDLKCFYNVCQHRGHGLVQGNGRANLIVCPYHAWSYDLHGQLQAAPGTEALSSFNKSAICLTGVRLEEFCGFVFINLDDQALSMRETFPGVEEAIYAFIPDIDDYKLAHQYSAQEYCNWMIAIENYNECYHCRVAHPDFAAGVIDPDTLNIQPFAEGVKCLHHTAQAQTGATAWYDTSGSSYATFFLWPAFGLQLYPSGIVNGCHWRPLAVDDTVCYRSWFTKSGELDETTAKVADLDFRKTFSEDLALIKSIQRGIACKGYRPGPLVLNPAEGIDSEHSIAALQTWLKDDLDDTVGAQRDC